MTRLLPLSIAAIALIAASSTAFAADLIVDEPATPVASADLTSGDWTGAYVGVHAGWAAGTVDWELTNGNLDGDYDLDGWLGGVQAGYNYQTGNLVLGVEASVDGSNISGEDTDFAPGAVSRTVDWQAAVTGKLGFAVSSLLFYGKAGVAIAGSTGDVFDSEVSNTHVGWTAGVGVEAMLTDNLSASIEYDFARYGAEEYAYAGPDVNTSFDTSAVKVGLNWHF